MYITCVYVYCVHSVVRKKRKMMKARQPLSNELTNTVCMHNTCIYYMLSRVHNLMQKVAKE